LPAFFADESEQFPFLGVGGFYAALADLPYIEATWRAMKVAQLGLAEDDELKWNLPEGHGTRLKLEQSNSTTRRVLELAISTIAGLPLTGVCMIMREQRSIVWQPLIGRLSIRHHYCTGLQYALQRVAEETHLRGRPETSICIIDEPGGLQRPRILPISWPTMRWLVFDKKAANQMYRTFMANSIGQGPARVALPPLRQLAFASGLLMGHATHDDLLQIADHITGCFTSLVKDTSTNRTTDWIIRQAISLLPRMRGAPGGVPGNGLVLWPFDLGLWNNMLQRLGI
jgi:hypothetical protein